MAEIDFADLNARERYKLLISAVVPRPIALVTSISSTAVVNAAPFAFFNAVCNDPPAVFVGVNSDAGGREKDTAVNIKRSGEFVVNMVDEALSPLMNLCETEFPQDVSETTSIGLRTAPSVHVAPPRIEQAPISFECKLLQTVSLAPGKAILIGRVLHMYVDDRLYDPERNYILTDQAGIIGRMHGAAAYVRTTDLFDMPRLSIQEKRERFGELLDAPSK